MSQKTDKNPYGAGRPTSYSPSVMTKVEEYLMMATKENMHLPKIESLALFLDVERKTLYNWANAKDNKGKLLHPEFKKALEKIMGYQFERLVDDGIYGGKEVNVAIVKMMLINNHGLKDESNLNFKGEITEKFNDRQRSRIAERIIRGGSSGDSTSTE